MDTFVIKPKTTFFILSLVLILLFPFTLFAWMEPAFDIDISRLSKKIAVASGSKYHTNLIIIQTEKGLVLIDTGISPEYAEDLRYQIKNEFKEDHYLYVINTHHHWDHVQGNQVFKDATIIAHRNCTKRMNEALEQRKDFKPMNSLDEDSEEEEYSPIRRATPENRDTTAPPPPPINQTDAAIPPPPPLYILYDDSFILTPPTLAVDDKMEFHLEDITIQIYYYGKAHTDNDLLVFIPEEKLLAVGDLFFKNSLPKFFEEKNPDIENWINLLHQLLDNNEIEYVVSGHNELMTQKDLFSLLEYIEKMWIDVRRDTINGISLPDIQGKFALKNKFPHLQTWDIRDNNNISVHQKNVEKIYNIAMNLK